MNIVAILISLVVLTIGMILLHKILDKLLPAIGIDADWKPIILGIIGLIVLIVVLGQFGYGPAWFGTR